MGIFILGIETSCDDTSAAILEDDLELSNVTASQEVHQNFGGVVPELASRAHQQHIIPVVEKALSYANINKKQIHAVAFTNGPGLLGSLLVGVSFSKSLAVGLKIPIIEVHHLQAHVLAHFIRKKNSIHLPPEFPFLCLLVSGGHTQIMKVSSSSSMEIIGQTLDDAAGEAFDKAAKIMGFAYPGGPLVDKFAREGNATAYYFPKPNIPGLNFSFSGLKTSLLYFLRDRLKVSPAFIEKNRNDICASFQKAIVDVLLDKLLTASKQTGIKQIALAGGVSANSSLRKAIKDGEKMYGWKSFIPDMAYCTDNAAMIAIAGYYKYMNYEFASQDISPFTRQ